MACWRDAKRLAAYCSGKRDAIFSLFKAPIPLMAPYLSSSIHVPSKPSKNPAVPHHVYLFKYTFFNVTDTAKPNQPQERALPNLPHSLLFIFLIPCADSVMQTGHFPLKSINRRTRWWVQCICNITTCLRSDVASSRASSSVTACWLWYYFLSVVLFMHHCKPTTFLSTKLQFLRSAFVFHWVTLPCHPSCIFPLLNKEVIRHFSRSLILFALLVGAT